MVFPAHAGMNRVGLRKYFMISGVPRSCGDEPGDAMTL